MVTDGGVFRGFVRQESCFSLSAKSLGGRASVGVLQWANLRGRQRSRWTKVQRAQQGFKLEANQTPYPSSRARFAARRFSSARPPREHALPATATAAEASAAPALSRARLLARFGQHPAARQAPAAHRRRLRSIGAATLRTKDALTLQQPGTRAQGQYAPSCRRRSRARHAPRRRSSRPWPPGSPRLARRQLRRAPPRARAAW